MSNKKFKKIDKRHTAYSYFNFYAEYVFDPWNSKYAGFQQFFIIREWCWQTWGPSKEIQNWIDDENNRLYNKHYGELHSQNEYWSWGNEEYKPRIYFRTEKELSLYLMKWP